MVTGPRWEAEPCDETLNAMRLFFEHMIQIATGIGACAACVLFLHLLGLLLIPNRHTGQFLKSPRAAFVGAAVTVIWCTYGLQFDIPLQRALFVEICVALVLLALRRSFLLRLLANPTSTRRLLAALGMFALFFTLTYCFLLPPASSDFLPIVTNGNRDIFNYINCTRFLQHLGPSNIANFSFREPFGGASVSFYDATPAVFYVLSGISTFFGGEPMRAAMPTIFGTVALVGCAVTWLVKIAFDLPKPVCVALAAVVVSGPFFRYNVGHYFLSQILGMAVVLLLLGETARILTTRLHTDFLAVFLSFLPFHIVLCFTYSVFSVIGLALQIGLVLVYFLLNMSIRDTEGIIGIVKMSIPWTFGNLSGVVTAWLVDPWHGISTLKNLVMSSKVGTIGWVQDFISPLALLGIPVSTEISGRNSQLFSVIGYAAFVLFIGFMMARHRSRRATIGQTFYVLAALSSVLYFTYFFLVGPSYQQWKLAGYLPLTMSFAILAAAIKIALLASAAPVAGPSRWHLSGSLIACLSCLSLVSANMATHYESEPSPLRFSANYANLRMLDNLAGVQTLFIEMNSFSSTFFPVYFIRNKLLHLISPSYYSQETLNPRNVSPRAPLFLEGQECVTDKYHSPLPGLGCLFFRGPTLTPDRLYQFSRATREIADIRGLSVREPWGRWSDGKKVIISLSADDEDLHELPNGYINFDLSTFLGAGIAAQNVSLSWGQDRKGHLALSERSWISLPISEQDWVRGDVRKLSIEFDLPDAISPKELDVTNSDSRTLAVGFIAFSWTVRSLGQVPAE